MHNKSIRVIIVDDHAIAREGLRSVLSDNPTFEVVGEAETGTRAIDLVNEFKPDVMLADIRLPDMSGIDLTRSVKQSKPELVIILMTVYDSEAYIIEGIRAGAAGYVTKDASADFIRDSVVSAFKGGTVLKSDVKSDVIQRAFQDEGVRKLDNEYMQSTAGSVIGLTDREVQVLKLIAEGHKNAEIARELDLAEITIKKQMQSIFAKLNVSDRTMAVVTAARLGVVQLCLP